MRALIPCRPLSRRGWNPVKLEYKLARWPAQLATSAFSQLSMSTVLVTRPTVTQNSPFASPAVAVTIASTHFAYPRRDDQAELPWEWVAWLNTMAALYPSMVTHLSTNPAQCRITLLMCQTTLPLSQTSTVKPGAHLQGAWMPGIRALSCCLITLWKRCSINWQYIYDSKLTTSKVK